MANGCDESEGWVGEEVPAWPEGLLTLSSQISTAFAASMLEESRIGYDLAKARFLVQSAQGPHRFPSLHKNRAERHMEACWLHAPCTRPSRRVVKSLLP